MQLSKVGECAHPKNGFSGDVEDQKKAEAEQLNFPYPS